MFSNKKNIIFTSLSSLTVGVTFLSYLCKVELDEIWKGFEERGFIYTFDQMLLFYSSMSCGHIYFRGEGSLQHSTLLPFKIFLNCSPNFGAY